MQVKNIYKFMILVALAIVFQSRSAGPAAVAGLQVTGAPGSSGNPGTCANAGCHIGGTFDPSISIELIDMLNPGTVTEYVPGETYTLRIVVDANTGNPTGYGFQAVVLDDNDENASTWGAIPAGVASADLGGRSYIEHSAPAAPIAGGEGLWDVEWIAPAAGTGNVTFYSAGLAMNGNGSTNGDATVAGTFMVAEKETSSITSIDRDFAAINIAPNPMEDIAVVKINSQASGAFNLNITDITGRIVYSDRMDLQVGENSKTLQLDNLEGGVYALQLIGKNQLVTKQLLKL